MTLLSSKNEINVPKSIHLEWLPPGMLVYLDGQYNIEGGGYYRTNGNSKAFLYVKNELEYDDKFYVIRGSQDKKKLSYIHLVFTIYFLADEKLISQTLIEEVRVLTQQEVDDKIDCLKLRIMKILSHS